MVIYLGSQERHYCPMCGTEMLLEKSWYWYLRCPECYHKNDRVEVKELMPSEFSPIETVKVEPRPTAQVIPITPMPKPKKQRSRRKLRQNFRYGIID